MWHNYEYHRSLSDGGVMRVDLQGGHWWARWFNPGSTLRAWACGDREQMELTADTWFIAYEASFGPKEESA